MPTTVIHVRDMRDGDVYIGRKAPGFPQGSIWGNPFHEGRDGTREEVIKKYRQYLREFPLLTAQIPALKGKRLACWCKPKACHGDVLARLAEAL